MEADRVHPASATAVVAAGAPQLLTIDIPSPAEVADVGRQGAADRGGRQRSATNDARGCRWPAVGERRRHQVAHHRCAAGAGGLHRAIALRRGYPGADAVSWRGASSTSLREPDPAVAGASNRVSLLRPSAWTRPSAVSIMTDDETATLHHRLAVLAMVAGGSCRARSGGRCRGPAEGGSWGRAAGTRCRSIARWTLSDTAIVVGALVALFFVPPPVG